MTGDPRRSFYLEIHDLEALAAFCAIVRGTDTQGVIDRLKADAIKIEDASRALGEVSTQLDAGSPAAPVVGA